MKQKSLFVNLFMCLLLVVPCVHSQQVAELIFRNSKLESGTNLKDGAIYRFPNAAPGVDALVEIKGRSGTNVVINEIDLNSAGWDKAFQPYQGIPGKVAPNQKWWVEYEVSFVKAGTTKKQKLDKFYTTSLDIDGDNFSIQEFIEMEKAKSVTYSTVTSLKPIIADAEIECGECGKSSLLMTCSNCKGTGKIGAGVCGNCKGFGKLHTSCGHAWDGESNMSAVGSIMEFVNIDTLATALMATYTFEKKDHIKFKIGAQSGSMASTFGMRLNSMWYKEFNMSPAGLLPVKLVNFNAKLNQKKVVLSWTTEEERNFSHFILEQSFDGINFKETAMIMANDNGALRKEYSFSEELKTASKVIIYYRLKIIDANQQALRSPIRVIKTGDASTELKVQAYPNPVVNELRITLPAAWQNTKVSYDLYSANGRRMRHVENSNANQTETLAMNSLEPGVYIIKINSGNETIVKQVMKSK